MFSISILCNLLSNCFRIVVRMEFTLRTFRSLFVLEINSVLLFRLKNDLIAVIKSSIKAVHESKVVAFTSNVCNGSSHTVY